MKNPAELFLRVWRCQVFDSGYHTGTHCSPETPHTGRWHCGWRWAAPPLTDEEAADYGIWGV